MQCCFLEISWTRCHGGKIKFLCSSIYADIGDEQSLLQSLSTFSGRLKKMSEIISHSTIIPLVLLDEVGAGTNPLDGAALGMAILESFAESGSLLTMATIHITGSLRPLNTIFFLTLTFHFSWVIQGFKESSLLIL